MCIVKLLSDLEEISKLRDVLKLPHSLAVVMTQFRRSPDDLPSTKHQNDDQALIYEYCNVNKVTTAFSFSFRELCL